MDKKGRNLLHNTLEANQLESILFLLAIKVDVNSCTRDASQTPPLHLAAAGGNEVIVRSLILAGAKVRLKLIILWRGFYLWFRLTPWMLTSKLLYMLLLVMDIL